MTALQAAAERFLSQQTIAVVGVSRSRQEAANMIFRKLRDTGYEVFPVNPRADEVEGESCYADLSSVPARLDAVVVVTPPSATADVVRECAARGIQHVWIHRSFGRGSRSQEATEAAREAGIDLIDGACPMMFCEPVDMAHRCVRWVLRVSGGLPEPES